MARADPEQLKCLLALKKQERTSDVHVRQALQIFPKKGAREEVQPSLESLMDCADPEQLKYLLILKDQQGMSDFVFRHALQILPQKSANEEGQPSLDSLMERADPEQLKYLLILKDQQGMSDLVFRQALQILPKKTSGNEALPTLESLKRSVNSEQLEFLLKMKDEQGMSDLVFRQALQLLPPPSPAATPATSQGLGAGLDVEGHATEVPPAMTPAERAAWERDGMFWRRGAFSPAVMQAAKRAVRAACAVDASPLGMVTGPGARVFFADDPTAPALMAGLIAAPQHLGPLRDIVGDNVDHLYTKAVWKDAEVRTGFGWHWDQAYWGGSPKFSTWLALDDADAANGCLKLVRAHLAPWARGGVPASQWACVLTFHSPAQYSFRAPALGVRVYFSCACRVGVRTYLACACPHAYHGACDALIAPARSRPARTHSNAHVRLRHAPHASQYPTCVLDLARGYGHVSQRLPREFS